MSTGRRPKPNNTVCCVCTKEFYRKPSQKTYERTFCSKDCYWVHYGRVEKKLCIKCGTAFKPDRKTSKYCSQHCAHVGRTGITYSKEAHGNPTRYRVEKLQKTFNIYHCMVEGCSYSKTFDVHRLVHGKDGGEYEIGNMFIICPNHHAECHRGLIQFEKISDSSLRAIQIRKINSDGSGHSFEN